MAHGHYRHSRISKRLSAKHRRDAESHDEDSESDLFKEIGSSQIPISDSAILSDETCDSSNYSMCLEHGIRESEPVLGRRDKTTSPGPAVAETVLHVSDASSSIPSQSTATEPAISDVTDTSTLPSSESLAAIVTATASLDIEILTSPTLAPATQPTTSLLPETSVNSTATSTEAFLTSTTSTTSATQVPSPLRAPSASVINSPAWTSTPLVAPSTSTGAVVTTTPQVHNWSYSGPSASFNANTSTSSAFGSIDTTVNIISSSSNAFTSSGSTATATATGTGTGTGLTPTTTEAQPPGQESPSNPNTPKIVGGVIGSVAGLALFLVLLLYYLRRRGFFMSKNGRPAILGDPAAGAGAGAREITERRDSNDPLFTASYFAPAFMKRWRQSTMTTRSGDTIDSAPSERGFQKISGRKIPPVLTHGGDGYGGGLEAGSPIIPGLSPTSPAVGPIGSSSFYAPPPTSAYGMPLDSNYTREVDEHTTTRPNHVHLPVSSAVNVAMPITVTPAQPIAQPQSAIPFVPPRPDGLGRSLPSFDGSRSSRFTEGIDL